MSLYHSHPLDNLLEDASDIDLRQGTILSSDTDTDKLFDWNPAAGLRIAETTMEIVVDSGSAVSVGLVALIHNNLTVAARIQRNATDSWVSNTTVDQNFAIPSISRRGLFTGPWLDLQGTPALRYTRLLITTNGYPVSLGEWFLGSTIRSLSSSYLFNDANIGARGDTVLHVTHANTDLTYARAVGRQFINGSVYLASVAEKQHVEDWRDAARDMARPFVLVPDAAVKDAWMCRFASDERVYHPLETPVTLSDQIAKWRVSLPVSQLGHSLAWIDADAL